MKHVLILFIAITLMGSLNAQNSTPINPLGRFAEVNLGKLNQFTKAVNFPSIPETTIINHLPASSLRYVGSPTICVLPNGSYVAAHDVFGPNEGDKPAETHVFHSSDKGVTWTKQGVFDIQTSTLFYYKDALYMMGTRRGGVNCWLLKSTDEGKTWQEYVAHYGRYGMAPTPVLFAQGRMWRAVETGGKAFMLSASTNSDITDSNSWISTNGVEFPIELSCDLHKQWLEGNAVERVSDGKIINILRINGFADDIAACVVLKDRYTIEPFSKENFVRLPGACKKFTIRHDAVTGKYYSLVNWVPEDMRDRVTVPNYTYPVERTRNTVAVATSRDLKYWKVEYIALQASNPSTQAFQYIDWVFEGDDIIYVSRTAWFDGIEEASSAHDANFFTFHRIKNFRNTNR